MDFGLSRLVPGINLLSTSVILGYRLDGTIGAIMAFLGLMLPSALVTMALTVGFSEFTANPVGAAVVRGVVPVTAALTFALAYEQGREVIPWGEIRTCALMAAYGISSFLLVAVVHASVALVIVFGILLGALLLGPPRETV